MSRGAARRRAPTIRNDQRLGHLRPSPRAFSAIRRMLVLVLPFAVAGCMVGRDFEPADELVAEHWLQAGNPDVKTDRQDYEQWWNAFNDPTLNSLVERACHQNLSLMAAGTRVLEARAALGVAI